MFNIQRVNVVAYVYRLLCVKPFVHSKDKVHLVWVNDPIEDLRIFASLFIRDIEL